MRGSGNLKTVVGYDRSDTVTMKNLPRDIKDPGENTFMNYGYEYSPAGNITAKNTEHGNYAYQYDELYRLTNAVNPASSDETYTYDAIGNRLTAAFSSQPSADSYTYNANNELTELLTQNSELTNYSYDDDGNMTQRTVGAQITNYIYDIQDRLVQVEDGSSSVIAEYYYDPFGRRLWKEVSGVRTYYFYSEEGLIGEYDSSGTEIKTYGYAPDSIWSTTPLFQKVGSNYYWYINDHLGTPQVIIDTTGRVVWAATYDSFGNAQISTEEIENNLRFAGQYYDAETGLHYNWYRYYDPTTGRYTRVDPIGFAGGDLNLYAYVNNPINFVDPWGLKWVTIGEDYYATYNLLKMAGNALLIGTEFNNKFVGSDPMLYVGIARDVIQRWEPDADDPDPCRGGERRITQRVMEYVRFENGVFASYYGWSPYVPDETNMSIGEIIYRNPLSKLSKDQVINSSDRKFRWW